MLSRSSSNPEAQIFFYITGITFFLISKNALVVVMPILINKYIYLSLIIII